jgi:hypothetical protein
MCLVSHKLNTSLEFSKNEQKVNQSKDKSPAAQINLDTAIIPLKQTQSKLADSLPQSVKIQSVPLQTANNSPAKTLRWNLGKLKIKILIFQIFINIWE